MPRSRRLPLALLAAGLAGVALARDDAPKGTDTDKAKDNVQLPVIISGSGTATPPAAATPVGAAPAANVPAAREAPKPPTVQAERAPFKVEVKLKGVFESP